MDDELYDIWAKEEGEPYQLGRTPGSFRRFLILVGQIYGLLEPPFAPRRIRLLPRELGRLTNPPLSGVFTFDVGSELPPTALDWVET